jgi:hypothetical protein
MQFLLYFNKAACICLLKRNINIEYVHFLKFITIRDIRIFPLQNYLSHCKRSTINHYKEIYNIYADLHFVLLLVHYTYTVHTKHVLYFLSYCLKTSHAGAINYIFWLVEFLQPLKKVFKSDSYKFLCGPEDDHQLIAKLFHLQTWWVPWEPIFLNPPPPPTPFPPPHKNVRELAHGPNLWLHILIFPR